MYAYLHVNLTFVLLSDKAEIFHLLLLVHIALSDSIALSLFDLGVSTAKVSHGNTERNSDNKTHSAYSTHEGSKGLGEWLKCARILWLKYIIFSHLELSRRPFSTITEAHATGKQLWLHLSISVQQP
jgi:hypothetical protein